MSVESATEQVIAKFPREVAAYRSGHTASLHVLIGQVKRRTHGQADTDTITKALKARLAVADATTFPQGK